MLQYNCIISVWCHSVTRNVYTHPPHAKMEGSSRSHCQVPVSCITQNSLLQDYGQSHGWCHIGGWRQLSVMLHRVPPLLSFTNLRTFWAPFQHKSYRFRKLSCTLKLQVHKCKQYHIIAVQHMHQASVIILSKYHRITVLPVDTDLQLSYFVDSSNFQLNKLCNAS